MDLDSIRSLHGYAWVRALLRSSDAPNVTYRQKTSITSIRRLEGKLGFTFPADFYDFYCVVNGYEQWGYNEALVCIWPIELIESNYFEQSDQNFIGFADYSINCHWFGFIPGFSGIYRSYDNSLFADNFKEAILLLSTDSELIY